MVACDGAARHVELAAIIDENTRACLGLVARDVAALEVEGAAALDDDAAAVTIGAADLTSFALARVRYREGALHREDLACSLVFPPRAIDGMAGQVDGDVLARSDLERHVLRRRRPVAIERDGRTVRRLVDHLLELGPVGGRELGLTLGGRDDRHARRREEEGGRIDTGGMAGKVDRKLARTALEGHANLRAIDAVDHIEALVARHEEVAVHLVFEHGDLAADAHVVRVAGHIDAGAGQRGGVLGYLQLRRLAEEPQRTALVRHDAAAVLCRLVPADRAAVDGGVAVHAHRPAVVVRLVSRKRAVREGGRTIGADGATGSVGGLVAAEGAVADREVIVSGGEDAAALALGDVAAEGAVGELARATV